MNCPVASWSLGYSGSTIASSKIYFFLPISPGGPMYSAALSLTTGSVLSSRYKTSMNWGQIQGTTTIGDYVAASVFNGYYNLLLWNTISDQMIIK